jgi:hypothetical protein
MGGIIERETPTVKSRLRLWSQPTATEVVETAARPYFIWRRRLIFLPMADAGFGNMMATGIVSMIVQ